MKKYDFVIIGCGISCLYFLKKVKKMGLPLKIAILEKKPIAGGRIHSIKIGDNIIDSGAMRFNKDHKLLWKLLKEYQIPGVEELVSRINVKLGMELEKKFKEFLREGSGDKYARFAFGEIAKTKFTAAEYQKLKLWYGYDQEWEEFNCQRLCQLYLPNYDANEYFHVKDGLSQLINAMFKDLEESFDFFIGEKVVKIAEGNNIYTWSNKHFVGDHIIFACPPHSIMHINGTNELRTVCAGVGATTLNRIYAKFRDDSWFPKEVIHSSRPISQVVPIGDGVIMISYTTERGAKYWIEREIDGTLWEALREDLRSIGMEVREKPEWIKQNYWNPATHYYRPNFSGKKTQEWSFQPILGKNWHIIGEAFSMNQGWMEGALQNAELFFKKYFGGKLKTMEKIYTMKEVEKHNTEKDAWLVLYGNVYDVTRWIPVHPGGDVIKYGIGKDATEMFENVGHNEDALEFMNNYKIGKLG